MPQLITIGETMAAFTPASSGALRYVSSYGIRTAGAESNVAVGLAKLGISVGLASSLMPKAAVAANDWDTCVAYIKDLVARIHA